MVSNTAESALEYHLGMTCNPLRIRAGSIPRTLRLPCGKRVDGVLRRRQEVPGERSVDLDITIAAMALTEGGLAVSVAL